VLNCRRRGKRGEEKRGEGGRGRFNLKNRPRSIPSCRPEKRREGEGRRGLTLPISREERVMTRPCVIALLQRGRGEKFKGKRKKDRRFLLLLLPSIEEKKEGEGERESHDAV